MAKSMIRERIVLFLKLHRSIYNKYSNFYFEERWVNVYENAFSRFYFDC